MSNVKAKLVKGSAVKLDRGSKYLILFDRTALSGDDLHELQDALAVEGFRAIAVALDGSPSKVVKIIEESK